LLGVAAAERWGKITVEVQEVVEVEQRILTSQTLLEESVAGVTSVVTVALLLFRVLRRAIL